MHIRTVIVWNRRLKEQCSAAHSFETPYLEEFDLCSPRRRLNKSLRLSAPEKGQIVSSRLPKPRCVHGPARQFTETWFGAERLEWLKLQIQSESVEYSEGEARNTNFRPPRSHMTCPLVFVFISKATTGQVISGCLSVVWITMLKRGPDLTAISSHDFPKA